jgi:hypothetical protein
LAVLFIFEVCSKRLLNYLLLTFNVFLLSIRSSGPDGTAGREVTSVDASEEPFYANHIPSETPQENDPPISQQEDNSNISRLPYFFKRSIS